MVCRAQAVDTLACAILHPTSDKQGWTVAQQHVSLKVAGEGPSGGEWRRRRGAYQCAYCESHIVAAASVEPQAALPSAFAGSGFEFDL